ncbi:MAG TPA: ROK family protein [Fimbriimonadaceae bacterium]|nr:ROK family protein [Fimbriimonadaceae bacterium]
MPRCVVGVDLGGTNVRACAYFEDGSPAGPKFAQSSEAQSGNDAIFAAISACVRNAAEASSVPVERVGMAVPGHIDDANGVVRWSPNFGEEVQGIFHHWQDVSLKASIEQQTGLPVSMGNDANLAALGEYRFGAGKNSANCLVLLTVGTGIGGGVVMKASSVQGDARGPLLLLGGNKGGGELGHIVVQHGGATCNAGSYGAIEGYCQRDAIVERAVNRLRRGRNSLMNDMVSGDLSLVTPKLISDAADAGDELAIEVWSEVGTYLGVGVGSCINIFAPDVVAIGGQIAYAGEWLIGPARRAAENCAIPSLFSDARIVQAECIDDAGMLGGAALALQA